jgi:hypothetical protein
MNVKLFSTTPSKGESFWQIILLPTITMLRSPDPLDRYTVVSFEWLFWSVSVFSRPERKLSSNNNSYYTNI